MKHFVGRARWGIALGFLFLSSVHCVTHSPPFSWNIDNPRFPVVRECGGDIISPRAAKPPIVSACDVNIYLAGQIQEGFFQGKKIRSLNDAVPDLQSHFRHRMSLELFAQYGNKAFGRSAVDACIKLHNMFWWQDQYSNLLILFYRVTTNSPVLSFSDAWCAVHLDAFNDCFEQHPHTFKIGFFPYLLGRGLSLGYTDEGSIKYLGFELTYDPIESAYYTPGILWQGDIIKDHVTYELYYSLMQGIYQPYFLTNAPDQNLCYFNQSNLFRNRLDLNRLNRFGKNLGRAVWSGKLAIDAKPWRCTDLHAEPYVLWLNSTYGLNDFQLPLTDRTFHIGTYGMMLDYTVKRFNVNIEVAGQFGSLLFHPIDNNEKVLDRNASGQTVQRYTDVFSQPILGGIEGGMPAVKDLEKIINRPEVIQVVDEAQLFIENSSGDFVIDRDAGTFVPFTQVVDTFFGVAEESAFGPDQASAQYLSSLEDANNSTLLKRYCFSGGTPDQKRTRPAQRRSLHGYMALLDISYLCESIPFKLNFAAGYVSGDRSPLIGEFDEDLSDPSARRYNGFIPLRDHGYRGHAVKSFTFLTMRTIERPAQYKVHFNDTSNLALLGVGFDCWPLEDRKRLHVFSNVLWFFQPGFQEKPNTTERSSKVLSIEINGSVNYKFLENCSLLVRGAIFIPGKLYRDMANQTVNYATTRGTRVNIQRGHDISYAYHVRLSYDF